MCAFSDSACRIYRVSQLSKLLSKVTIASGGVLPNIHQILLPVPTGDKKAKKAQSQDE